MRLSNRHNNDPDGFEVPILEWIVFYGISTLDLVHCYVEHKKQPPLTEAKLTEMADAGGTITQNQVDQTVKITGTDYKFTFEELGIELYRGKGPMINHTNLVLEQRVNKEEKGKHYRG